MSTKDLAVVDTDTALAPSPADRGRRSPARVTPGADLDVGGSTIGTVTDDDAFALDHEDEGGREIVERDVVDPAFPKVRGHRWQPEDTPILESFGEKASEIGLTQKQSNSLAEWFIREAAPLAGQAESVDDFEFLAEGIEDSALGKAMSHSFKEFALGCGMAPTMADQTVSFFLDQCRTRITAQDAQHREESIADVGLDWGENHAVNVRETQAWLKDLGETGKILRNARAADGRRLIFSPGIPQLLHEMAMKDKDPSPDDDTKVSSTLSDAAKLRKEAASIRTLRDRDRDAYYAEWRHSGVTASDRLLEIERELGAKVRGEPTTSSAARARDLADERRELVKLEKTDPESFEHGRWRDSKITPAERLHQIVSKGR